MTDTIKYPRIPYIGSILDRINKESLKILKPKDPILAMHRFCFAKKKHNRSKLLIHDLKMKVPFTNQ